MPHLNGIGRREDRERECQHHRDNLRREQRPALRQVIGDQAPEQAEDKHRGELRRGNQAESEWASGQGEHEPGLGNRLHPCSDEADELAREEEPVVPVAKRPPGPKIAEARPERSARLVRPPRRGVPET